MIWLAVIATFGASFLLVWQLLNWLVGHVRWLPKGSTIVTGVPVSGLPDHDGDPTRRAAAARHGWLEDWACDGDGNWVFVGIGGQHR